MVNFSTRLICLGFSKLTLCSFALGVWTLRKQRAPASDRGEVLCISLVIWIPEPSEYHRVSEKGLTTPGSQVNRTSGRASEVGKFRPDSTLKGTTEFMAAILEQMACSQLAEDLLAGPVEVTRTVRGVNGGA